MAAVVVEQESKQAEQEEYFHLPTDYTRSAQQGKVNTDDQSTLSL